MSGFVTNMCQYDVTVGITRSEVIFFEICQALPLAMPSTFAAKHSAPEAHVGRGSWGRGRGGAFLGPSWVPGGSGKDVTW